jgi:hypothetical protein
MHLKFVETESTFDLFQATREYLEAHGKPVAFYSDKHGVFRVNSAGAVQGDGMTQFGRSLHALNIDISVRQHATGKEPAPGLNRGPGRARQQDLAGSSGQGIASSPDQRDRRRQ